jgi:hypothetical protein
MAVQPASAQTQHLGQFDFTPFEFSYPGGLSSPALDSGIFSLKVASLNSDPGVVLFTILNASDLSNPNIPPTAPTVTRIFFDDNFGILNFNNASFFELSTGASFSIGGMNNVPGGDNIGFSADFRFSADPPPSRNGLDPNEFLTLSIGLNPGFTAQQAVEALALDNPSANLRVALHVQEIGVGSSTEASASYISVVPEPSALLLVGAGGLLLMRRRRK